jgi:hypothetical protein
VGARCVSDGRRCRYGFSDLGGLVSGRARASDLSHLWAHAMGQRHGGAACHDMVSHDSGHSRPVQGSGTDVPVIQGYGYTQRKARKHQGITMDTYTVLVEAEEDRAEPTTCAQRGRQRSGNGTTTSCHHRRCFWPNRDEQQHEGTKASS